MWQIRNKYVTIYQGGDFMIIMNIKADNFYCFDNFEVDFSYPKIIPSNMVEYEYLEEYKNFRFKKVNIIMGENASGKTNFGKFLMQIFNFIVDHNHTELYNSINDKNREASFAIDILMRDNNSASLKYDLYRLSCTLNHIDKSKYDDDIKKNLSEAIKKLVLEKVTLKSSDSYERATERNICKNGHSEQICTKGFPDKNRRNV